MSRPTVYIDTDILRVVAELVAQYKQRTYELMCIETGHAVLDVGCGPGTDTVPLAQLVGPGGQVIGVDYDRAMLEQADQSAEQAGVRSIVQHRYADAESLPFEDNTFDACRSERLFIHLRNPERVFAEMVRVTKSGGRIVVLDSDGGTLAFDTVERETERLLKRYLVEEYLNNAYSGRQLYRFFRQQQLVDVSVELCPILGHDYATSRQTLKLDEVEQALVEEELVTQVEIERWRASLQQAAEEGVFFCSITQVLVAGRKP
jgi:ubiquinone/menaquinone biosynthesis C-methylase UbiE